MKFSEYLNQLNESITTAPKNDEEFESLLKNLGFEDITGYNKEPKWRGYPSNINKLKQILSKWGYKIDVSNKPLDFIAFNSKTKHSIDIYNHEVAWTF